MPGEIENHQPSASLVKRIGFVGAGQMAQALGAGFARTKPQTQFAIFDPNPASCEGFMRRVGDDCVIATSSNQEVFEQSTIVFLAVKPQMFSNALAGLPEAGCQNRLIVSVMAGIKIEAIKRLTHSNRVIRVMPNTPCLIGKGASAIACSPEVGESERSTMKTVFESIGLVEFVDESLLDGVTGISGSGPAYVFSFIEAMIAGGIEVGLDPAAARRLAQQTVLGAATMLVESDVEPAVLRNQVTSPGGTTLAGLKRLDEFKFREGIIEAIKSASERARELGSI